MLVELVGTEALSLELSGTVPVHHARALLGALTPEARDGRSVVNLLIFRMTGMRARGIPFPALDYGEALWRIGIVRDGEPAWFALRCDLDDPFVRSLGRTAIRYPVRTADFQFVDAEDECTFQVEGDAGRLSLLVVPQADSSALPLCPRRVLARGPSGRLYEIPWREEPGPQHHLARVTWRENSLARATLGDDIAWDEQALLLRGRIHHCGLARKLRKHL